MKTASVEQVNARLNEYLKATENGPLVITRNDRPIAVMFAVEDQDDLERLMMANSPALQAILGAARKRIRDGKGLSSEEFWKAVEARKAPIKRAHKNRKSA